MASLISSVKKYFANGILATFTPGYGDPQRE